MEGKLLFFNSHCNDNFSSSLMITSLFSTFLFSCVPLFSFSFTTNQQLFNITVEKELLDKRLYWKQKGLILENSNSVASCHPLPYFIVVETFHQRKKELAKKATSNERVHKKKCLRLFGKKELHIDDGKNRGEKQQKLIFSFSFHEISLLLNMSCSSSVFKDQYLFGCMLVRVFSFAKFLKWRRRWLSLFLSSNARTVILQVCLKRSHSRSFFSFWNCPQVDKTRFNIRFSQSNNM